MNFSEARRSPGWVLLTITLAAVIWGAFTFINHATSSQIYVVNCGLIDYQPDVIYQACADGNIGVGDIIWDKWSKDGATGEGVYAVNNCQPDCASGEYLKTRVELKLSGQSPFATVNNKEVFTHIYIKQVDGESLPMLTTSKFDWDLSDGLK